MRSGRGISMSGLGALEGGSVTQYAWYGRRPDSVFRSGKDSIASSLCVSGGIICVISIVPFLRFVV
jgi:hypothetical protein